METHGLIILHLGIPAPIAFMGNLIWLLLKNIEVVIRLIMFSLIAMVNLKSFLWEILVAVTVLAKVDKFLILVLELVLHKMEMVLSDITFGEIQMFDLICSEPMYLCISIMNSIMVSNLLQRLDFISLTHF